MIPTERQKEEIEKIRTPSIIETDSRVCATRNEECGEVTGVNIGVDAEQDAETTYECPIARERDWTDRYPVPPRILAAAMNKPRC